MLRNSTLTPIPPASRFAAIAPTPTVFNMGAAGAKGRRFARGGPDGYISGMYRLGWALLPFTLLYADVGIWLAFWLIAIPSAFHVDPPVRRARQGHQVARQAGF